MKDFKRTKILATIGPATHSPEAITNLIKSGANAVRLNFSHGDHAEHGERIKWVRKISKDLGEQVAVLQDLQGPKIRIGSLPSGGVELEKGATVKFGYEVDFEDTGIIPVQYELSDKVKSGEPIFLADGRMRVVVERVKSKVIEAKVELGGTLTSKKGLNLPDTDFSGDILTHKDLQDIKYAVDNGDVDYIALSFVQTAEDVLSLKRYLKKLKSDIPVIAKVETKVALDNITEIVQASDGVMVARGDLAIEAGPEIVPIVQRQIIDTCQEFGKFSIVATQMLMSMTTSLQPTRAEVSDVATAVMQGADAIMLSDETANGQYPVETVAMMSRVAHFTEQHSPAAPTFIKMSDHSKSSAIASSVMTMAHQVRAKCIIVATSSGKTARNIASHRPQMPILMGADDKKVAQQLALIYGGRSHYVRTTRKVGMQLFDHMVKEGQLKTGDSVVMTYGEQVGQVGGTNTIKVLVVE